MTKSNDLYAQMDHIAETRRKLMVERDNARTVLQSIEARLDQVDREGSIIWRKLVASGEKEQSR